MVDPFRKPTWQGPGPDEPTPSEIDQVEIDTSEIDPLSDWAEITTELADNAEALHEIKSQLAHHGWCELFVGLVQAIETYGKLLNVLPALVKQRVKQAILDSSTEDGWPHVTSAVVDVVIGRVWNAFKGATVDNIPLLNILSRAETLRSLRILAVVACPAPRVREEVRKHAWEPLGDDVQTIITAQMRARLEKSFEEWRRGA